mgnify:CR=1 FL=1
MDPTNSSKINTTNATNASDAPAKRPVDDARPAHRNASSVFDDSSSDEATQEKLRNDAPSRAPPARSSSAAVERDRLRRDQEERDRAIALHLAERLDAGEDVVEGEEIGDELPATRNSAIPPLGQHPAPNQPAQRLQLPPGSAHHRRNNAFIALDDSSDDSDDEDARTRQFAPFDRAGSVSHGVPPRSPRIVRNAPARPSAAEAKRASEPPRRDTPADTDESFLLAGLPCPERLSLACTSASGRFFDIKNLVRDDSRNSMHAARLLAALDGTAFAPGLPPQLAVIRKPRAPRGADTATKDSIRMLKQLHKLLRAQATILYAALSVTVAGAEDPSLPQLTLDDAIIMLSLSFNDAATALRVLDAHHQRIELGAAAASAPPAVRNRVLRDWDDRVAGLVDDEAREERSQLLAAVAEEAALHQLVQGGTATGARTNNNNRTNAAATATLQRVTNRRGRRGAGFGARNNNNGNSNNNGNNAAQVSLVDRAPATRHAAAVTAPAPRARTQNRAATPSVVPRRNNAGGAGPAAH